MKKIIAVNCSPRTVWNTATLVREAAKGAEAQGAEVTVMVRGGGIDQKCELAIQNLKNPDEDILKKICIDIGGEPIDSNADAAWQISFLPQFPITHKIWLPDEDFPASDRPFVDASADHYLTIEDAVTVAELLLEKLTL